MLILAYTRVQNHEKKRRLSSDSTIYKPFCYLYFFQISKKILRVGEIEKLILALNLILPRGVGFELL